MSFTFSHVAASVPLLGIKSRNGKNLFDVTAFILGSIAPDFEFFIKLQPLKPIMVIPFGHTPIGMFCYDLPLCFLFAWVFHNIIKSPLVLHLPQPFVQRYAKFAWQKWSIDLRSFIVFCYSAILAMLIHILWDSLTHLNSPVVQYINFLSQPINLFNHIIPLCKLLDHSGTILGLAIVMYSLCMYNCDFSGKLNGIPIVSKSRKLFFFSAILIAGITATLCWIYRYGLPADSSEIGGLIVAMISGLALGTAVISYLMTKIFRLAPPSKMVFINADTSAFNRTAYPLKSEPRR